jgi:BlaI family transcriptional regulator, penicillinase repressor
MNKITFKELELLKICINKKEASVRDIYEESLKKTKRSYTTIKTLLDRMVGRGFLKRRLDGLSYLYSATVTENLAVDKAIDWFVKNMLEDTMLPLFTYFVKRKKIKKEELDALRKLIDAAEKEIINHSR